MQGSPSSSETERSRQLPALCLLRPHALLLLALLTLSAGCVTVRPSDKEFLSDPSMTFGDEGAAGVQEQHVMTNREGSFGAGSVSGGGCGCN